VYAAARCRMVITRFGSNKSTATQKLCRLGERDHGGYTRARPGGAASAGVHCGHCVKWSDKLLVQSASFMRVILQEPDKSFREC
jgi:hypothetical protein